MPDGIILFFVFALGACVGSFLNVVAYRMPLGKSVVSPPSACPNCNTRLAWKDNIPILGWLFLRGKCRYCSNPVSIQYPAIELFTALLFAGTYVLMFMLGFGPCAPMTTTTSAFGEAITVPGGLNIVRDWPVFVLYLSMIGFLLAASLIDAKHFIIPLWIPWILGIVGVVGHALIGNSKPPGNLVPTDGIVPLMTIGGGIGLLISLSLLRAGVFKQSFAEGEPMLDHERKALERGETPSPESMPVKEYSRSEVRAEMRKEMIFLMPPLVLSAVGATLALQWPGIGDAINATAFVNGALGALFGAFIGALVVWLVRVLGSMAFGREAMGMGDVHLMLGVGAVIGAGASTVAFFLAPFPGLLYAIYRLIAGKGRELPYGPYLAIASVAMIFLYCPIAAYLRPGLLGLVLMVKGVFGAAE
jgi:leader peptidase (prepilin peptidase) / N-methyltransferase